ncbi:hypothetical protein ACPW96_15000 [Micromonospora sp. DT81.3]|uniref:hypothetical protein n=1 Tax=Micromonospora sp. DT81.3 TaxID=3416523 RepID=UPI003CEC1F30
MTRWTRRALIVLAYFCAISAVGGGVLGVAADGAGVPLEYLKGTAFTSYLIPGLILGIVIGGTQTLAAITTQRHHPYSHIASTVAGFGMIIWIFVELAITGYVWLQTLYLALGIAEIALVLLLMGMLRPLARTRLARASVRSAP